MQLTAIEPFYASSTGKVNAGEVIPDGKVSDREARQLIAKGLAKMGPVPENKMAAEGSNKADPSAADGEVRPSSASPAARALPRTTAKPSAGGARKTPAKKAPARKKPSGA